MNDKDQLKTLINRIEYHQKELNSALADLIRLTDSERKTLPIERTTDRARILSTLEDGALLSARQITAALYSRGIMVRDVAQKLCGLEKDLMVGCNREQRWKRYYLIKTEPKNPKRGQ